MQNTNFNYTRKWKVYIKAYHYYLNKGSIKLILYRCCSILTVIFCFFSLFKMCICYREILIKKHPFLKHLKLIHDVYLCIFPRFFRNTWNPEMVVFSWNSLCFQYFFTIVCTFSVISGPFVLFNINVSIKIETKSICLYLKTFHKFGEYTTYMGNRRPAGRMWPAPTFDQARGTFWNRLEKNLNIFGSFQDISKTWINALKFLLLQWKLT